MNDTRTFSFNVTGAGGMGFGALNRATATGASCEAASRPVPAHHLSLATGGNACTRPGLRACIEISLHGNRPF